jgi:hypothetical protein
MFSQESGNTKGERAHKGEIASGQRKDGLLETETGALHGSSCSRGIAIERLQYANCYCRSSRRVQRCNAPCGSRAESRYLHRDAIRGWSYNRKRPRWRFWACVAPEMHPSAGAVVVVWLLVVSSSWVFLATETPAVTMAAQTIWRGSPCSHKLHHLHPNSHHTIHALQTSTDRSTATMFENSQKSTALAVPSAVWQGSSLCSRGGCRDTVAPSSRVSPCR